MPTKIFVNLPVEDLTRATEFFTALGYKFNSQFSDENAGCLVISDDIFAMLLTKPMFAKFTPKPVADAHTSSEVIVALSADSREEVDRLFNAAVGAGGTAGAFSMDDGFMYGRSFADPDGHLWEVLYMAPPPVAE
jgi:uncharacterized protein